MQLGEERILQVANTVLRAPGIDAVRKHVERMSEDERRRLKVLFWYGREGGDIGILEKAADEQSADEIGDYLACKTNLAQCLVLSIVRAKQENEVNELLGMPKIEV